MSIEEFRKRRASGNEKILSKDFLPYKRFFALDSRAYEEGVLTAKQKELIGLACSLTLRCNDCVAYHLERCVEAGCDENELNEAMNIALVIGGSVAIPHLRYACEIIEELKNEQGRSLSRKVNQKKESYVTAKKRSENSSGT